MDLNDNRTIGEIDEQLSSDALPRANSPNTDPVSHVTSSSPEVTLSSVQDRQQEDPGDRTLQNDVSVPQRAPQKSKTKKKTPFSLDETEKQLPHCKAQVLILEDRNKELEATIRTLQSQLQTQKQSAPPHVCHCAGSSGAPSLLDYQGQNTNKNSLEIELIKTRMEVLELKLQFYVSQSGPATQINSNQGDPKDHFLDHGHKGNAHTHSVVQSTKKPAGKRRRRRRRKVAQGPNRDMSSQISTLRAPDQQRVPNPPTTSPIMRAPLQGNPPIPRKSTQRVPDQSRVPNQRRTSYTLRAPPQNNPPPLGYSRQRVMDQPRDPNQARVPPILRATFQGNPSPLRYSTQRAMDQSRDLNPPRTPPTLTASTQGNPPPLGIQVPNVQYPHLQNTLTPHSLALHQLTAPAPMSRLWINMH